ncbi:MAG: hypothetical protein LBO68_00515, partial [Synergistaceae bacterium]|nr:hypothetical protein [Synergistaceae bacterium]
IQYPGELEPRNENEKNGKNRKECVFYDFVVNSPVFKESNRKKSMRSVSRRGSNTSDQEF